MPTPKKKLPPPRKVIARPLCTDVTGRLTSPEVAALLGCQKRVVALWGNKLALGSQIRPGPTETVYYDAAEVEVIRRHVRDRPGNPGRREEKNS